MTEEEEQDRRFNRRIKSVFAHIDGQVSRPFLLVAVLLLVVFLAYLMINATFSGTMLRLEDDIRNFREDAKNTRRDQAENLKVQAESHRHEEVMLRFNNEHQEKMAMILKDQPDLVNNLVRLASAANGTMDHFSDDLTHHEKFLKDTLSPLIKTGIAEWIKSNNPSASRSRGNNQSRDEGSTTKESKEPVTPNKPKDTKLNPSSKSPAKKDTPAVAKTPKKKKS